ncbi:uncharacterized protein LOC144630399 [Oculina patagonica]
MVGYQLHDADLEKITADPHLGRLICCYCKCLVREPTRPTASTCGHTFCRSCLVESNCKEGSSSVAVCPEDGQKFLLQETEPDVQSEEQVKSLPILCPFNCYNRSGQQCPWYGEVRQLEKHFKDYHQKGKTAAAKESTMQNPLMSGNSRCQDPTLPRSNSEQSWPGSHQNLMRQQSMENSNIEGLKQQYALLCTKVKDLEQRFQQNVGHIELLKEQLGALGDAVVTRKRDHEQLQNEMRTLGSQVQVLVIFISFCFVLLLLFYHTFF